MLVEIYWKTTSFNTDFLQLHTHLTVSIEFWMICFFFNSFCLIKLSYLPTFVLIKIIYYVHIDKRFFCFCFAISNQTKYNYIFLIRNWKYAMKVYNNTKTIE